MCYFKLCFLVTFWGVSAALPGWITPVQDGLQVKIDETARVITGYWTLIITLNEPVVPIEFYEYITEKRLILNKISATDIEHRWVREWIHRLDQIEQKLNSPNRWWQGDNDIDSLQRQKRGLFDFIGKASHFLFGTATSKEVNDVKDTLRELGTNQGRIRHDMVRFASVVNHTFDEMNKTRQMLKDVNDFAIKGLTYTNTALHLLQRWTNAFNVRHQWDSIMDQLESLTDYFLDNHQAWKTRRGNVEIGRLTESILPPDVLLNMLNLNLPVSSEIISPYEWYYQNTIVKPLWTDDDIIVFKATLPLVAVDAWRHLQFQVWPIPLGEHYIRLNLPTSLLHDTRHNTIMLEPTCLGRDPLVCVASSVGSATQYPCVNSLLQHEPKYDDKCYITVSHTPDVANNVLKLARVKTVPGELVFPHLDWVYAIGFNEYVLSTLGTELTLQCYGLPSQTVVLSANIYSFMLPYPCRLVSPQWELFSVFMRTHNMTLRTSFTFNLPNVSFYDTVLSFAKNMPTDRHLLITDVDRQSLQLSDLIDVKYPTTSVFDQWWWWFLGSAFLVTIIIIVCYFAPRVYKYRLKPRTNLQRTTTVPNTYETIGTQHIPNSVPVLQPENISDSGW